MTAAEAAAQIAATQAAYSAGTLGPMAGVFSLDQLHAMGQTGNAQKDWMATGTANPGSLIGGGGNAVITAKGLQAGYYQVPGQQGAEFYDPSTGQASKEFVDWANALTPDQRDPFTGQPAGFIPAEGGPEAANAANQMSTEGLANAAAIIAGGKGADGTYQDSQDRVLGIGKYQQFLTGANGQQVRIQDATGSASNNPTGAYQDRSASKGGFDALMKLSGGTREDVNKMIGGAVNANAAPIAATPYQEGTQDTQASLEDALAANYQQRALSHQGLAAERIARGEDPNTGISAAETKQIYDTYNRISDPAEKAAFLRYQDPGNLTAGLRAAQYDTKAGERAFMGKNVMAPTVSYSGTAGFGGTVDYQKNGIHDISQQGGQVKTTYGDVTQTDKVTGRSTVWGNVPVSRSYQSPKGGLDLSIGGHKYLTSKDVKRIDAGILAVASAAIALATAPIGGTALFVSMMTSAYLAAGGWLPDARHISFKDSRGWSQWKSGDPQEWSPVGFAMSIAAAKILSFGAGKLTGTYVSASTRATSAYFYGAAPSVGFMSKYGMATFLASTQLQQAAKGRQAQQDFMTQQRQKT